MLDRIDWCLVHPGMMYGVCTDVSPYERCYAGFRAGFFFARSKREGWPQAHGQQEWEDARAICQQASGACKA
ncbi:hypothetical protein PSELUDRAFT_0326 [Vogesella sp. LIG4]|nr:hypothetical protein PSELUDRAFT_0326 [Vogesella sp. LIG4]